MLYMIAAASILLAGQGPASPAQSDARCGGFCLYVAMKTLDVAPSSYPELEKMLGRCDSQGYSMAKLEETARGAGLATIAVDTTLANLAAREERFVSIGLLNNRHYVIFVPLEGRVQVVDPPKSFELPIDSFHHLWTGKALLLGRTPFQSEESLRQARGSTLWEDRCFSDRSIRCTCFNMVIKSNRQQAWGATKYSFFAHGGGALSFGVERL